MAVAPRGWDAALLHFWFHELSPHDWWGGSPELDARIARRFGHLHAALATRPADEFLGNRDTARAAILLFDQVPRNIHRGTPQAFASDRLARQITCAVIARGWGKGLSQHERAFLAMPLMHSESVRDQLASLAWFRTIPGNFAFARAHYRMVARFGRFPHRNAILGRRSSAAEERAVAAGNAW